MSFLFDAIIKMKWVGFDQAYLEQVDKDLNYFTKSDKTHDCENV